MRFISTLLITLSVSGIALADDTRLLRFPDIHENTVVFVYAGDIYSAPVSGGTARRLTSHAGLEVFPKLSPDGTQIAFSAEYNGTRQVYVMPTSGGEPRQLTWYNDVGSMPPRGGYDYRVLDWTPDGKHVLVRANRTPWGIRMGRFHLVPVDGGDEQPLALTEGGAGMFSPDGSKIVFTPKDREFRTWKRYRGGRAQDVWTWDIEENRATQLTRNDATDNHPMWVGDSIYFTSDRDYTLNLYRYDESGSVAVTDHENFDVLWPSAGPNAIVYENGGWLYRFDPDSGASVRLSIEVVGDRPLRQPKIVEASEFIESMDIAPDGQRVVINARGELFTVPKKEGPVRNITQTPAVREINPAWSPDGETVAFLSDASGEYEIWVRDESGAGEARQVTSNGTIWRFPPVWSPDGNYMLFGDKNQTLNLVDMRNGRVTAIDRSSYNDITSYSFAPDSAHIAYTKNNSVGYSSIYIYAMDSETIHKVTDDMTDDNSPVFDPDGRYLYFLSSRDQDLDFSSVEFNYMVTDSVRVFAALLNDDAPALFLPKSDETGAAEAESNGEEDADSGVPTLSIDFDGISDRVVALQGSGGVYRNLAAVSQGPLYLSGSGSAELRHFKLADEKEETILKGVSGFTVARDGQSILYMAGGSPGISKVAADQKTDDGKLDLDNMELRVEPVVEWQQMYVDGWRILRDWFYDPNMHGMDWDAIRDKYAPLVPHVAHRGDLDYIFGEIAGEMNAGHIYVQSGDEPSVTRRNGGLLGADVERRGDAYRITKVFEGEAWHPRFYSPLDAPGVNVSVGDYILAVNGESVADVDNFYTLLENTGGDVVSLRVNDAPRQRGARDVLVRTIASESGLRYLDWVADRVRRVKELSNGRIGYLHLPNTAQDGNRELFKRYLPQVNKDALIIDARYNGGGFIPDRMIEIVSRQPLNYWKRRGLEPTATPVISHVGPKATLINGYSSSGGDAFPWYFRQLKLGPLIGTRTWGGLIGISGNPSLADGGSILASTFRFMDTDGKWAVENEGVAPDIEVVDRPDLVAAGRDPSLEAAVRYLLEELEKSPPEAVSAPPAPTDF